MTREEQILSEAKKHYSDSINCHNAFLHGVEWADEHPKSPWISTENELPTKGGHYLCMDENHHISTLVFCGNRWVNSSAFFDVSLEVVKYWMPIPNLPEE